MKLEYSQILKTLSQLTSCHDKESRRDTTQCKLSTKQNIYFYKLNTSQLG